MRRKCGIGTTFVLKFSPLVAGENNPGDHVHVNWKWFKSCYPGKMNLCLFWGDAHEWGRPVSVFIPILMSVGWWGWNLAWWKRMLKTGTCKWMTYCHCLWRHLLLLSIRGHVWLVHLLTSLTWGQFGLWTCPCHPQQASCDGVAMRCWGFLYSLRPFSPDGAYPLRLSHWVNFKLRLKSRLPNKIGNPSL